MVQQVADAAIELGGDLTRTFDHRAEVDRNALDLQAEGVRAITTNCGFLALFQGRSSLHAW